MKIKIIAGTMVALSFSLMSCSDFLTEDPRGKLTPENFFSTQDELNMSIYALYQKVNLSQVYTNMQLPQWQGDDITTNPGSNKQPAAEMDKFAAANNNKGVKDAWNMHYAIVKAANLIIQGASKTPTTQDEINIALGQAKFWRAYAYFTLVRLWGPLPMNLDNVNDDYTKPLSPVEEVYGHIVQDLTEAEAVLPTGCLFIRRDSGIYDERLTPYPQLIIERVRMRMAGLVRGPYVSNIHDSLPMARHQFPIATRSHRKPFPVHIQSLGVCKQLGRRRRDSLSGIIQERYRIILINDRG